MRDNWSCFTSRPIPIHVDDDARGFITASGGHVHRGIKIKSICEFQLGYAIVQDYREAVAAGVRQIFAVNHDGQALWEMGLTAFERAAKANITLCSLVYPWDDGNLIVYSSGTVIEGSTGNVLSDSTFIREWLRP